MPESETAPSAGLWRRLASLLYDGVLLFGLVFVAGYLFVAFARDAQSGALRLVFQIYLLAVCGAYFVFCWVRTGQTLAMKTWGLRLVTGEGAAVAPLRALLRFLVAIPSIGSGLGLAWAFFDRDRCFLHDRIAGTRIIRKERAEAAGTDGQPPG
jgi:uncharacterized RDD family membrane protein YckC